MESFPSRRILAILAVVGLVAVLAGCGGGPPCSSNPTAAGCQVIPTPPPPPPPPTLVAQGGGSVPEDSLRGAPFTTTLAGRLDVTLDWTFATNDVDVYVARGGCFVWPMCDIVAFSTSVSAKPERVTVPSAAAGAYTLVVANVGPTDESVSFQVVLTPSAAASAAATPLRQALPEKAEQFRGGVVIH